MFGEGTDPENNRRTYFPVTRGSALDDENPGEWRIALEGPH